MTIVTKSNALFECDCYMYFLRHDGHALNDTYNHVNDSAVSIHAAGHVTAPGLPVQSWAELGI